MPADTQPDIPAPILIAGPTATGKSTVSLRLAERLGAEIVSVDSMQVYKGLDIGTAKPSVEDRRQVPHHLIDVADVSEPFDAARFATLARHAVDEIQQRGRVPLLCGGTGLYFKALLEGIGQAPPPNAALRAALEALPLSELLRELKETDPETCERIDRRNPRRVIRAVEVVRLTGRPYSQLRSPWTTQADQFPGNTAGAYGLSRAPNDLRTRIDFRVDEMFRRGLVEETRVAVANGLEQNRTAMQAIGYRQVVQYLNGERTLEQTIELVKIRTRQYAKRQMTWFRRQMRLNWIPLASDQDELRAVEQIVSESSNRAGPG